MEKKRDESQNRQKEDKKRETEREQKKRENKKKCIHRLKPSLGNFTFHDFAVEGIKTAQKRC